MQADNIHPQGEDRDVRAVVAEDLERAIANYKAALSVFTRDEHPADWARTQQHLGDAYASRLLGDRSENLEQAIANYEAALSVFTRDEHPSDWARTQQHLGDAYASRPLGDRTGNLRADWDLTHFMGIADSVALEEIDASKILERTISELTSLEERVQRLMIQYAL